MSLWREGGKDGRREEWRMRGKSSERNRVKEREGIRFVSVCVFVCLYEGGLKSKRRNGSVESAFYSLQLLA